MPPKLRSDSYLPSWLGSRQLAALPGIVGAGGHLQHLTELANRQLGLPLGDVTVGAHRVGWPSLRLQQALTKAFFKMSSS